ncbi:MAG: porin family protein [bacterium]
MRKLIYSLIAVALAVTLLIPSQSYGQVSIGKGLKVGLNSANITGDDVSDSKARSGFLAGVFLKLGVGSLIIQPELLYTVKGAKVEDDPDIDELKLTYLEIPVLVKINLGSAPKVKPNIFAGPAFGILLSSKVKGPGGEVDFKDITKSSDLGVVVGAGIDIGLVMTGITFDIRYTFSLSSIDDSGEDADVKNRVLSATAGISF